MKYSFAYNFLTDHGLFHMSEFPEPQQESAAACENRDIGPFSQEGSKTIDYNCNLSLFEKSRCGKALTF